MLSLPLPFESETIGTSRRANAGVSIRINLAVVAELVLSLGSGIIHHWDCRNWVLFLPMDEKLSILSSDYLESALTKVSDTERSIMRRITAY